jgi:hypothetical protein
MVHMGKPATKGKAVEQPAHLRPVTPEVRTRRDAVLSLLRQEIGVEDITDLIIRGGFHKPSKPLPVDSSGATDPTAANRFRQSVRRLVYYDIEALTSQLRADQAARLPLAMAVYERQQAELYKTAERRWTAGSGNPVVVSKAGELAERASKNLAVIRGIDVNPKQKVEHDLGERAAKAHMHNLQAIWRERREKQPQLPGMPGEHALIDVTPGKTQQFATLEPEEDDDTGDYN